MLLNHFKSDTKCAYFPGALVTMLCHHSTNNLQNNTNFKFNAL